MNYAGRRVTVMGLGHFGGGAAAARWLARRGAEVTVTDMADAASLAAALASLRDVPIAAYHLGGHRPEDFRQSELLVVNPAVRPGNPFLNLAKESGVPQTSELELFLAACPARVLGVTGSNGKSTTAAMTAAILRADGRSVHLGGNIGRSLLDAVDQMSPDEWVVLEISSFQLLYLGSAVRWPQVAVVTNCTPNHLDWHGTWHEYVTAKQRILLGQQPDDLAVLNPLDAEVASWANVVRGRQVPLVGEAMLPELPVPGRHNRDNARLAATAALGIGCRETAVWEGLSHYQALPDRLQWFAEVQGRQFYNDTAATTPESTIAALESLAGRTWLLAGGSDKGSDWHAWSEAVVRQAHAVACYGAVREVLRAALQRLRCDFPCVAVPTLEEALAWCWKGSASGDNILLSPACASRDQFLNYRARGIYFRELVERDYAARAR